MSHAPEVTLGGVRVALLESRLAGNVAAMVRRLGGVPVTAPSLAEVEVEADEEIRLFIERLAAPRDSVVVLLTGVAVTRLFAAAERLGLETALRNGLAKAATVARGNKPAGALARRGVPASRLVGEPFTTADVLITLETMPIAGREVTVVHYGERSEPIMSHLSARGAHVRELMLYEWQLPRDLAPLSQAVDALIAGEIPVLVVTSQVQVRHLFEVAGAERRAPLLTALNAGVLVGAIGPTCAAACKDAGIHAVLTPERPKLASLLLALASAVNERPQETQSPSVSEEC